MVTRHLSALSFLVVAALLACNGNPEVDLPETSRSEAGVTVREDAASVTAECDQAVDGTSCGDGGTGGDGGTVMHCLYNACVLNVCGDGIRAGSEVCDDGDQEDDDGCNSHCQEPMCGNGVVDAREQCDDGNTSDDDDCSASCRLTGSDGGTANASGSKDAGMDAGSVTDSGGGMVTTVDTGTGSTPTDTGTGSAPMDSGSATDSGVDGGAGPVDSGTPFDAAACQACVRAPTSPCLDWQFSGPDNVAACFNNADPTFVERCTALYRCAVNDTSMSPPCGEDLTGLNKCFCGSTVIDVCFGGSAQPNGPCIQETYAATNCTTPQCVGDGNKIIALDLPSGPAQYLVLCTKHPDGCGSACPRGYKFP